MKRKKFSSDKKRKFDMNTNYQRIIANRKKYVKEQLEAQDTYKSLYADYIASPWTTAEKRQESIFKLIQVGATKTMLDAELQFLEQL